MGARPRAPSRRSAPVWSAGDARSLETARDLLRRARLDDASRSAAPRGPEPDPSSGPLHPRRFTLADEFFDDPECAEILRRARVLSASRDAEPTPELAAAPSTQRKPTVGLGAMTRARGWIRDWRARVEARRPPPETTLVRRVAGDHVLVTLNRDAVERAARDPSAVLCVHLAESAATTRETDENAKNDPVGFFDEAFGGRWEGATAARIARIAKPGAPALAAFVCCRRCHDAAQERKLTAADRCARCRVAVPKSATGRIKPETAAIASPSDESGEEARAPFASAAAEPLATNSTPPLCVFCAKRLETTTFGERRAGVEENAPPRLGLGGARSERSETKTKTKTRVSLRRSCGFMDDADVPSIDALHFRASGAGRGAARVAWDPATRTTVSVERERRWFLPSDDRDFGFDRVAFEAARGGADAGAGGEGKAVDAAGSFVDVGDPPRFRARTFPRRGYPGYPREDPRGGRGEGVGWVDQPTRSAASRDATSPTRE